MGIVYRIQKRCRPCREQRLGKKSKKKAVLAFDPTNSSMLSGFASNTVLEDSQSRRTTSNEIMAGLRAPNLLGPKYSTRVLCIEDEINCKCVGSNCNSLDGNPEGS